MLIYSVFINIKYIIQIKNVYTIVRCIYCLQLVKELFLKLVYFVHDNQFKKKLSKLGTPLDSSF